MPLLTRRAFSLAAVSAPAAIGLTTAAMADGHATKPVPALFDASLGSYRITSILDGVAPLSKDMYFGLEPSEIDAALSADKIEGDALPAPVSCFLLQSEDRNILIDAGMGEIQILGSGFGRLTAGLAAVGLSEGDIDTVILTHAHPDHLGGLLVGGAAAFPNAELFINDIEYGFWGDDAAAAAAPEALQGLFDAAQAVFDAYQDRLRPVTDGAEVAPGLRLELSPGHTPGHSVVHIDGGDRQLLMVADTVHNIALHTALPDISFAFDIDSAVAAASRRRIFDRTAADGILIAGTHIPFPGFGRLLRGGETYRYVPATWL